jgi:hypothetical protein
MTEKTCPPVAVVSSEGLGPTPPLPRKKPAVFHHPTLGMPLYDGLAMDLHAMTYAEPLFAEIARLRAALAWYGDEAAALSKHMASGAHTQAVLASLTVLSLDAGRRAAAALGPNVRGSAHAEAKP